MSNLVSTFNQKNAPYFLDENWTWYYWKDIISSYQQGLIRSNSELNEIDGIDYFKMNFINENGTYTFNGLPKTFATSEEIDNYKIKNGDFFINVRNSKELVGKCCVVYDVNKNILFNHMLVRINHKEYVTGSFINAYFNTKFGKKLIETCKKGTTTVIALYQKDLYNIPIPIPKKNILEGIDEIYNSINKKIELNNRINAELEAMAKTLYDYWFVQFDFPNAENKPYKTSGGKMVYSETLKREIPEGWEASNLEKIAKLIRGVSYNKGDIEEKLKSDNIRILRATNITGNQLDLENPIIVSKKFVNEEQILNKFDILMTMSSGSIDHIGKNAFYYFEEKVSFGAFCAKLKANEYFRYFLYLFMQSPFVNATIKNECLGTNINNLNGTMVNSFKTIIPDKNILEKFNQIVEPLFDKIGNNLKQNQELSALRDWLLPMLMNGQVKVGE